MTVTDFLVWEIQTTMPNAANDAGFVKATRNGMAAHPELRGDLLDLVAFDEVTPSNLLVRERQVCSDAVPRNVMPVEQSEDRPLAD
ncbi:hypothetical protein ACFVVP_25715 [Streptomyces sp. NPDC058128]|uniref:hypothetical protein n=1 Tax=Streptomyces sp. NPDC058128 TaxID=3346352 RepID=UPI0036E421E2